MEKRTKIALFMPSLSGGGAERVFLWLAEGFIDAGYSCDLVVGNSSGSYRPDERVNLVDLGARHVIFALPALARYLRREKPAILLSEQAHANLIALWAAFFSGRKTRVVVTEHTILSMYARQSKSLREKLLPGLARRFYPSADAVVAVSQGAADDLAKLIPLISGRLRVIHNPLPIQYIQEEAAKPVNHPWLENKTLPVVLAVGRLSPEKDFQTLIRAVGLAKKQQEMRLVILGEGSERERLEMLVHEAGLEGLVEFPSFVQNPFAFMKRADVFVLSSRFEGFSMVLVEAMACGAPVIATDCPSGPAEILQQGRYGTLVKVGDVERMAQAILQVLKNPVDTQQSLERVKDYSVEKTLVQYLDLFHSILSMDTGMDK